MKATADVVIIGGGIQGLSLAYHLGKKGLTNVYLLEMNTLGSGSSGRSATIIGYTFQTDASLRLTRWSFGAIKRFEDELGASPGFEPIGCLLLAGPQTGPALRERSALLRSMGIASCLVNDEEALELTPGLNLEDISVAVYNAEAGAIDAHSMMMAYAAQARQLGVDLVEGVEVTGLVTKGRHVVGVETTSGAIATSCVVNAAGFRARRVAAWAGLDLPIKNLKRHIFVTGPVAAYAEPIPFTYDRDAGWYMRREGPGLILGMGSVESDEEDPQVDWSFLDTVVDHALHRAPPLDEATVKNAWAGLRPMTPDDDPILGPVSHLDGFFNDCGWGGHGIMHSPAAGMALAEWIVDGRPSSVDIGCFGAERFRNG
jgi:sarcosine oxidase subunit beta